MLDISVNGLENLEKLQKTLQQYSQLSRRGPEEIVRRNIGYNLLAGRNSFYEKLNPRSKTRGEIRRKIQKYGLKLAKRPSAYKRAAMLLDRFGYIQVTKARIKVSATPKKGYRKASLEDLAAVVERNQRIAGAGRTALTFLKKRFSKIKDQNIKVFKSHELSMATITATDANASIHIVGAIGDAMKKGWPRQALESSIDYAVKDMEVYIERKLKEIK